MGRYQINALGHLKPGAGLDQKQLMPGAARSSLRANTV